MIKKSIFFFAMLTLVSCASVFSQAEYDVSIKSTPSESNFKILDKRGAEIYSGKTPASVSLSAGDGYFSKAKYVFKFEKNGYETTNYEINPTINGWYFVNIPFLNVIGLLVVDPVTGAMYKFPENVDVSLNTNSH